MLSPLHFNNAQKDGTDRENAWPGGRSVADFGTKPAPRVAHSLFDSERCAFTSPLCGDPTPAKFLLSVE